jgi:hypothetical protein
LNTLVDRSDDSEHRRTITGAQGRNRTTDTAIFNRMLYQLSYLGAKAWYKSSTCPLNPSGPAECRAL